MSKKKMFNELMEGLTEASDFFKGKTKAKVTRVKRVEFIPVPDFSPEQIRDLRKALGLSQEKFSKLLSVSEETVKKWENGTNPPSGPSARIMQLLEKKGDNVYQDVLVEA